MFKNKYPFFSFLLELGPADFVHEKIPLHVRIFEFAADGAGGDADEYIGASLLEEDPVFEGDYPVHIKSRFYFIRYFDDGAVGNVLFEDIDDIDGPNKRRCIFDDDYFAFI